LDDGLTDGFGAVASKGRTVLDTLTSLIAIHSWQMQEHGEARTSLHERADRRTLKTKDEVTFLVTRDSPVGDLRRSIADHDGVPDKGLVTIPGTFARHPKSPARTQTGSQFPA
jgi:cell wall assembly regulator SMI1